MLNLTTPALLFPAISLLLLAYSNRFLAIAALIRNLHASYQDNPSSNIKSQLDNLRKRLRLIRNMQAIGIFSFFLCVLCMLLLFLEYHQAGQYVFIASLVALMLSLLFSVRETQISVKALALQLGDLEGGRKTKK